jgi:hypothetical protein
LQMIGSFLETRGLLRSGSLPTHMLSMETVAALSPTTLTRRVIACLDVRANDDGDLVVTKGDQYDVREANDDGFGR